MWIVRLALTHPFTFVVMAVLITILGGAAIYTTPVDIFPYIDIPVISVVWTYQGLSPEEMEKRVVTIYERALTTTVNDIEHIESQSYSGAAVVRVFLHPSAKVEQAQAQITSLSQSQLRQLPPGIFPPNILKYDASSVPILQLGLGSKTLSEQQIFDVAQNFIRTQLAVIQGAAVPQPYGGKYRQVTVDLNPDALYANQLSATDVSNAFNLQNLILPAGTAKIGEREYQVKLNSSPRALDELNNLPVKIVNGAPILVRDVAQVRDGNQVQTNVVRTNGTRGALLTVMRNGHASTLDIVNGVKKTMPKILAGLPPELEVKEMFDQSLFVRAAIESVVREAALAAFLTGLMILLFLGSWRSTIVVCISIPLSILTSICILSLLGQTINVMTLGGLALAVGILVDDATVEIENIHRNMAMLKPMATAVLDGAQQIAVPALVATLCICIVFVPVLLLKGTARYLFTPLAMAVVFAMLASYLLSRTLVATMAHRMLKAELMDLARYGHGSARRGIFGRIHDLFQRGFENLRVLYGAQLARALRHRFAVIAAFVLFAGGSMALVRLVGRDFFPTVDSGQLRLHARAPSGTRIEQAEVLFSRIEEEIRRVIPAEEIRTITDNIGLPNGSLNLAYSDNPTIGTGDGEIMISLRPEHAPTAGYATRLRKRLRQQFPDVTFFFEAANITNQILNFGLPSPIDIQISGRDPKNHQLAGKIAARVAEVPGTADVHIHQVVDHPEIRLDVNRNKAGMLGLTQRDVSTSMLISLSGTAQVAPNQWLNWANGVNYNIGVQTPQYRIDSLDALLRTPISTASGGVSTSTNTSIAGIANATSSFNGAGPSQATLAYGNPGALNGSTQMLSNLVEVSRGQAPAIVNHYNVQPVFDVYANVDRRDLGGVGDEVEKIVAEFSKSLPRGTAIEVRGQLETMETSFTRLGLGVVFAIVLVYLLMAVNFQSWSDPFIILMALPGALAGIVWMLFITQTTFSVPSLMGAIMSIGVATANSILVVVFANDLRVEGVGALEAAQEAGYTRMRPVMMTALAMIIGMLPMALGFGEGGEQNAPLGRAVIGGLLMATVATLFVVPVVYSLVRKNAPVDYQQKIFEEQSSPRAIMEG